ncbi:MAG: DUF1566 domain-containing protein [Gammaproteobacteria bacterium]|nr:DUF1566 domain-containing protein [Gammaproteobacteria bacterium]
MNRIYSPARLTGIGLLSLLFIPQLARAQTCRDDIIPATPDNEFAINADGTVTHQRTRLIWERCSWGQSGANCESGSATTHTWQEALNQAVAANSKTHKGHTDWRLPNKNELASLAERRCYNPVINTTVFPATPSSSFWSSSPYAYGSSYAWNVSFNSGYVFNGGKSGTRFVRLVRGGQAFDFLPVNQDPVAAFSLSPASGQAPLTVTLDAGVSSDPDGDELTYAWDAGGVAFGNGAASFVHVFGPGNYTVTLTVTDNDGAVATAQQAVTVNAPNNPPAAAFTVTSDASAISSDNCNNPVFITPWTVTEINAGASADPDGDALAYAWSLGAGQPPFFDQVSLSAGSYPIYLSVNDGRGGSDTASCAIAVNNPPPDNSPGKAIIIAASGAHRSNSLFPYTDELAQRMYRTLNQRGFGHEEIIYLNPHDWQDIDGDGQDDGVVDFTLQNPADELRQAFVQAANLAEGQQFVLYIHGHAVTEQVKITRNYWLESGPDSDHNNDGLHLRGLLEQLPAHAQQVIILDACYSGSVLDELAAPNRVIMTSSDGTTASWNVRFANFSETLITSLQRGETLRAAFQQAEQMIRGNAQLFGEQAPQMDDDGDGIYSSIDGVRYAAQWRLGREGQPQDEPEVTDVQGALELSPENPEADLWAKTSPGPEALNRVRAVLVSPDAGTEYTGSEEGLERREIELIYNANPDKQYFEATARYTDFPAAGVWQVIYQAQNLQGTWSESKLGEVRIAVLPPPVSITARIPRSVYAAGEILTCSLDLSASSAAPGPYDIYAALLYPPPAGYFLTINSSNGFSQPNDVVPYRENFDLSEPKTLYPLEMEVRPTAVMPSGSYQCCGLTVEAGANPWEAANWLSFHCQATEVK